MRLALITQEAADECDSALRIAAAHGSIARRGRQLRATRGLRRYWRTRAEERGAIGYGTRWDGHAPTDHWLISQYESCISLVAASNETKQVVVSPTAIWSFWQLTVVSSA